MQIVRALCLTAAAAVLPAWAADYALSPDGGAVVRLVPQGTVGAGTLDSSLLPAGWTSVSGSGATTSVSSYNAGFRDSTGGGEIKALVKLGSAPPTGNYLEWVQVLDTNLPLGNNSSPYLDNAASTSSPFYSLTASNATKGLPSTQLNFYDFSRRDPVSLATTDPINWNAKLYPVLADGAGEITVYDGVSWGWTMKKAMVGSVAGTFTNPLPASSVSSGVGTSLFRWGDGEVSWLNFIAAPFDTMPDTAFKLGTLLFHNGTIFSREADAVTFNAALQFDNVPEENTTLSSKFSIVNTPNTDDPIASADRVSIGSWGFTFNVLEGRTASVDVMAQLSTGLVPSSAGTESGASLPGDMEPQPGYTLSIVGLVNPSEAGFVTAIPEPTTYALFIVGFVALGLRLRPTRARRS